MILALPADVAARVAEIEAREGIPAVEFCHQAVAIWSQIPTADQRAGYGFGIMQAIVYDILRARDAAVPEA